MISERQLAANRRNAQRSTGPKTEAGKVRSRSNAVTHGLTATVISVLPHEDHAGFALLRAQMTDDYKPANLREQLLVDEVARGYWRLLRARRVETATLSLQLESLRDNLAGGEQEALDNDAGLGILTTNKDYADYDTYLRYESKIERSYYRALHALEQIQARRQRTELKQRKQAEPQPVPEQTPYTEPAPPAALPASASALPASDFQLPASTSRFLEMGSFRTVLQNPPARRVARTKFAKRTQPGCEK